MKIMIAESRYEYFDSILEAFSEKGVQYTLIRVPAEVTEEFLGSFISAVRSESPEYVLSFEYYSYLSNACKLLNIGYAVWITGGYDPANYDYTIRNEWNNIFAADVKLCTKLHDLGCRNVTFLPLAPIIEADKGENDHCDSHEPIIWSNCVLKESSVSTVLPNIKESTKGYLDGFCESHKNDLNLRPFFARMHDYVRDDITAACYAEQDSLETFPEIFDNRLFLPHLDRSLSIKYIKGFVSKYLSGRYTLVSENEPSLKDLRMTWKGVEASEKPSAHEIENAPINIVIPGFGSGSRITQDMWNIMAAGGSLIMPRYIDLGVLGDIIPDSFGNLFEYDILLSKYLQSETLGLRQEITDKRDTIKKNVLEEHTYYKRISELLEMLKS